MTCQERFGFITKLLLNYETGDVLLLSDLSDALFELKDFFLDIPSAISLIEKLRKCVANEMKQSGGKFFTESISEAVDIMQRFAESPDETTKNELIQAMSSFSCKKDTSCCKDTCSFDRDDETFQIFLTEVRGRLDSAQETILKLEENPDDQEAIQNLFRVFHTIKGECGFLKIATLGELTHNIENLLDELRNGKFAISRNVIDLLLEGVDMSRDILQRLEQNDYVVFNDVSLDSFVLRLKDVPKAQCSNLGEILVATGKLQAEDVDRILQKQKASAFSKRSGSGCRHLIEPAFRL